MIEPDLGFRAALGYEFRHFSFAVETGYTHITGTNPLVLDFTFIPLVFKLGYNLPIVWGLGLQADLGMGLLFSRVEHYENAINLLLENKLNSSSTSLFGGGRLYITYTFPFRFLKLYAGGGADLLFENDGLIPLPLVEAGISLSPLMLIPKGGSRPVGVAEPPAARSEEVHEPIPLAIIRHNSREFVIEEAEGVRTVRLLNGVYFQKNSVYMLEQYLPKLDETAKRLAENPALRLTLRAYSAPYLTIEWQVNRPAGIPALSAARAEYCAGYIMQTGGIAPERIKIEYISAEQVPEFAGASPESYRVVEIIIE
jgi:outer membrane protein OmpA-like peptidoglycan-associated protein